MSWRILHYRFQRFKLKNIVKGLRDLKQHLKVCKKKFSSKNHSKMCFAECDKRKRKFTINSILTRKRGKFELKLSIFRFHPSSIFQIGIQMESSLEKWTFLFPVWKTELNMIKGMSWEMTNEGLYFTFPSWFGWEKKWWCIHVFRRVRGRNLNHVSVRKKLLAIKLKRSWIF